MEELFSLAPQNGYYTGALVEKKYPPDVAYAVSSFLN
jgi:hypothetical protein